jgi:hypothetical protein
MIALSREMRVPLSELMVMPLTDMMFWHDEIYHYLRQ